MELADFAIWKFKNFEGKLEGFHSKDMFETRIVQGLEYYYIVYDIKKETANLSDDRGKWIEEDIPFSKLADVLKKWGFYIERTHDRHSSSYPPQNS